MKITISYAPLFSFLSSNSISFSRFQKDTSIASSTFAKLLDNLPVMITVLCKISMIYGLSLNDIVSYSES